ncbi:Variant surface antigen E [Chionoecetes opilio]|uniref:Variant surface antigen E n=1 Tax=Chionoecetes opilio TaxID=41210 RepID=A0A8J5CSJ9_CHIOP|nr:Variant surface antigen E [Chionoecetes opilio]
MSHDMSDDDEIIKQTTKLLVVGNTLQRKFFYCSREVKMELFRSHCYSIYCNSLWSRFKVAALNRLKVCHNVILKRLLGLPRWSSSSLAFAKNGVSNLDVIRRHSAFNLSRSRVELSVNSIITSVRQSSAYVCNRCNIGGWACCLYRMWRNAVNLRCPLIIHNNPAVPLILHNNPTVPLILHNYPTVKQIIHSNPTVPLILHSKPTVSLILHNNPAVPLILHNNPTVPLILHSNPTVPLIFHNNPTVSLILHNNLTVPLLVLHSNPTGPLNLHSNPTVPLILHSNPTVPLSTTTTAILRCP